MREDESWSYKLFARVANMVKLRRGRKSQREGERGKSKRKEEKLRGIGGRGEREKSWREKKRVVKKLTKAVKTLPKE